MWRSVVEGWSLTGWGRHGGGGQQDFFLAPLYNMSFNVQCCYCRSLTAWILTWHAKTLYATCYLSPSQLLTFQCKCHIRFYIVSCSCALLSYDNSCLNPYLPLCYIHIITNSFFLIVSFCYLKNWKTLSFITVFTRADYKTVSWVIWI